MTSAETQPLVDDVETQPLVPVMDRFARGYPKYPELVEPGDAATYAPIGDALQARFSWDAHFAAYSLPEIPRRLASSGAFGLGPRMVLFVVDVEPPGHTEVTDQWWALERDRIAQVLADHPGGYAYRTKGGYRILWQLSEPWTLSSRQDAADWSASYLSWLQYLAAKYSIRGDDTCSDWTRLYRLPLVTRGGEAQEPWTQGDPTSIGTWDQPRVSAPPTIEPTPFELPSHVDLPPVEELEAAARALAEIWPDTKRHDAQLALAGALARQGWPAEAIAEFATVVAELHEPGSGLYDKRLQAAEDSVSKVLGGDYITGWPTLRSHLKCSPGGEPGVLDGKDLLQVACSHLHIPGVEKPDPNLFESLFRASNPPPPPAEPGSFNAYLNQAALDVLAAVGDERSEAALEPLFEPGRVLLQKQFPVTPWLVKNLVTEGGVGVIATEPKSAKTWLATEVAMAVATGTKVAGKYDTAPDKEVAYFYAEDMAQSIQTRIRALAKGRGMDPEEAAARMHIQPRGRSLDLTKISDVALIVASCRRIGRIDLLILDPLRDIHSAEEDKADKMAPVMKHLRVIASVLECTVLFVHHSAKSSEATRSRRPGQKMRGSSVIHGSIDFGIHLRDLKGDGVSEFINTVDSEVKGARGAGCFELRLKIEDSASGTAESAIWNVRDVAIVSRADQQDEFVWAIVRTMFSPSFKTPASESDLRKKVGGGTKIVQEAVRKASDMGLIERQYRGAQILGWVLTDLGRQYGKEGCMPDDKPEATPIDPTSVAAAFVARTN